MKTQERIRVLIVESTPQVTKQLRKLLNLMDNIEILKDVRTGQEAIHEIRESKPEVAIVDINLADVNGLNLTEMIRRDLPMTQVVVVSEDKYYDTVLRAMRNGASDFVTHDATLDELSLAVNRAGEMALQDKMKVHTYEYKDFEGPTPPLERDGPQNGKIITVFSPKGGTGVTTIAVNLAIALQENDTTVAMVDSSMQFGDVAIFLNEMGKFSVLDLMPRIYELDTKVIEDVMLLHKGSGLRVLKAPVRPELAEQVTGNNLTKVLEMMREMFSYIVVNTSSFISDPVLAALDAGDVVVLVCNQEVISIKSTRAFLDLWDGFGLSKDRILVTVNRYSKQDVIGKEKISESLKHPVALTIPFDEETLIPAANLGIPFMLNKRGLPVTDSIYKLAELTTKKLEEVELEGRFRLFAVA
jgi:pilus assembly protein CpaE